ncbi:hypothetical protein [Christensenella minuta]|uniref:hypothetical protein n=1 Tax=Christensenella minuta TaxID=626937 RepID=UPI002A8049BA|nr:hypothetical protein [Christensenella minuta]MDY3750948.1 hypothetical protein [Christensenella minuta]
MQTGRLWQIRAKKERFVVKLYYTKIAACLQKGAVPIKKQRHYKFIAVCIAFLLCLGFPFSALAMQKDGYHHVDWPDFCFQVWDVAMTGQEAYELEREGLLDQAVIERSGAVIRHMEGLAPYEGTFERAELGALADGQEPGDYPVTLYLHADDGQQNYVEITVHITEPGPQPTPEPEPTPAAVPQPIQAPPPRTAREPIPERTQEPTGTQDPAHDAQPPFVPGAKPEEAPAAEQEPEPAVQEENGESDEWTPLAIMLFGGAGASGALFGISIAKDIGAIRWYNSKKK